jgi:cellobiose-specific phosphotransferase system component IIC
MINSNVPNPSINWKYLVSAGISLLAIIIALFKKTIIKWFYKPNLQITLHLGPPDCVKTKASSLYGISPESYYFRLWIKNVGTQRAEKVQVFVSKLSKKNVNGKFEEVNSFLPMNLKWSHSQSEIYA